MDGIALEYHATTEASIQAALSVYETLSQGVSAHLGGFREKVVLDLGVGFQFVFGGLNLALAIRDGARRCFGIDVDHPDLHTSDPRKVEFWRAATSKLGVECQGLDQGRVFFASTDVLWFDEFFSKITLLQMSASDMWFKDAMFDVVISNAVFEHVKKPREVLAELFRVVKPGGGAFITWNPFSGLSMGGHDVGIPYDTPWAHLRLDERTHIEALRRVFSSPSLYRTAFPPPHVPTAECAARYASNPGRLREQSLHDLNKMRVGEFLQHARDVGFEVLHSGYHVRDEERPYLTEHIRRALPGYSDEELLTVFHSAGLRKPPSA